MESSQIKTIISLFNNNAILPNDTQIGCLTCYKYTLNEIMTCFNTGLITEISASSEGSVIEENMAVKTTHSHWYFLLSHYLSVMRLRSRWSGQCKAGQWEFVGYLKTQCRDQKQNKIANHEGLLNKNHEITIYISNT